VKGQLRIERMNHLEAAVTPLESTERPSDAEEGEPDGE